MASSCASLDKVIAAGADFLFPPLLPATTTEPMLLLLLLLVVVVVVVVRGAWWWWWPAALLRRDGSDALTLLAAGWPVSRWPGRTVLDVGAGTGLFGLAVAAVGKKRAQTNARQQPAHLP